jgi:hypothetical protein
VSCGERGCEKGFGLGEVKMANCVVGLAGAAVGSAGDGYPAAFEDFDCAVLAGNGYECSPAGVDANSDGGAVHRFVLGSEESSKTTGNRNAPDCIYAV